MYHISVFKHLCLKHPSGEKVVLSSCQPLRSPRLSVTVYVDGKARFRTQVCRTECSMYETL